MNDSPIDFETAPLFGIRFGYTRVSTVAQTLHQQHDALKAAGASKIYSDTMSGARDDRPGLAALMDQLRAGDTVVVWKLDRLGRNMLHILETVKALTEMGVTLVSTSDGIDSSTAAGRMMIGVLGSLAEYERELDQGANGAEKRVVSRQRHQVRTAPQGRRHRAHRHCEADEGGRSHRQGHSEVPRREPGNSISVPHRGRRCLMAIPHVQATVPSAPVGVRAKRLINRGAE